MVVVVRFDPYNDKVCGRNRVHDLLSGYIIYSILYAGIRHAGMCHKYGMIAERKN